MPEDRPAIPADIRRKILTESGHRCAVCGREIALDIAHIVLWSVVKEHKADNLVCLCATCHRISHKDKWDRKTLLWYKSNPWVNRQRTAVSQNAQLEITLDIDLQNFDQLQRENLRETLAIITDISPNLVNIKAVIKNSILAIIEMPRDGVEIFVNAYKNRGEYLSEVLAPFKIIEAKMKTISYVGTIVGESTTREFRLAVAASSVKEQDIIAVDSEISDSEKPDESAKLVRVWAKVQTIERLNPLFPQEAGHELAATRTNPFDTVLSLSREMVTAVCQVLGVEPIVGGKGKLDQLRYPTKPATMAYRPDSADIARIVVGDLNDEKKKNRALDIATLANRSEVDVMVDGHSIVSRHLAILAMTGAGKSVTARRVIEELAKKNYPIVIFDPHGDYTGLAEVPALKNKVNRYFAQFPLFDEDADNVVQIVNSLGYLLTDTMQTRFGDLFKAAQNFIVEDEEEMSQRIKFLSQTLAKPEILQFGVQPDLWLVANLAEAGEFACKDDTLKTQLVNLGWNGIGNYSKTDARTLEGIKKRTYKAAAVMKRMETTNRRVAASATPLPTDRKELVKYGQISVISLAGYTGNFQATIYSLIADEIFDARVKDDLKLPVLLLLEEAHNFVPARANTPAEMRSIETTKQIAQEGRKFGVGLILISQRPSRLDETTLSQCNSFVIMRMVNPADQNFVRRVIESLGEDEAKNLPNLDVGEALLSGQMINFPVLVKIKEPESKGEREEKDAFVNLEESYREILQNQRT
jgi:uncharacterized protein